MESDVITGTTFLSAFRQTRMGKAHRTQPLCRQMGFVWIGKKVGMDTVGQRAFSTLYTMTLRLYLVV